MSTELDPAATLRRTLALRAEHGTAVHDFDDAAVAAVLDELKQLRAAQAERDVQWSFRIADNGMTYACKLCGYMSSKFSDDLGEIVANCQRHHAHFHPGLPDSRQAERNTNMPTVPAGHGPGVPGAMHLDAFGRAISDAFGHTPYHVGSSATSKTWRDVDVRLILPDDEFDALFPGWGVAHHIDALWSLLCAALSELGRVRTGLPIDFQIQRQTEANEKYPTGIRNPLMLIRADDEHRPTMTASIAALRKREQEGAHRG